MSVPKVDPTRDFIIDVDIEEVRRAHNFDSPNAPYQPEVLALARAAERLADEVERLRGRRIESEETGPYELAALLAMFQYDLHPAYANTSRRGRGIGGQAITAQCNYLDPEGNEFRIIERIDAAVREWFHRAEREGIDMQEVHRRIADTGSGCDAR